MKPKRKKFTFGTCGYSRTSPRQTSAAMKAINIVVPFEEALKLGLAIDECCRELNTYDRSTKRGRDAALLLTVFLDSRRIAVNEDHV